MNAPLKTAPVAITRHEATVLDIGGRLKAIGDEVIESNNCSPEDQGQLIARLLHDLSAEYLRLGCAQTSAYELAEAEALGVAS